MLDAAVRSWPPVQAQCLRWAFPVWMPATDLDPRQLRSEKPKKQADTGAAWTAESFIESFVDQKPKVRDTIIAAACDAGLSRWRATCLLREAEAMGLIHRHSAGRNRPSCYATTPPAED